MMISQSQNRVQAIKSKFENLNTEKELVIKKKTELSIYKNGDSIDKENISERTQNDDISPNVSYLYSETKNVKKALTRQTSDPGKKLQRSHAFRCDRAQKISNSPKRHGSCYGRSESGDFTLKMGEKKLSKERLKRLGNLLEDQMRKENFHYTDQSQEIVNTEDTVNVSHDNSSDIVNDVSHDVVLNSIPDSEVPQHILDQYAKVNKTKKREDKHDAMTDSGVSSETENLEDERNGRTKKLVSQFEKQDNNLELMNDLCASSETMRLERKNPHLTLTDTLKKALKQPLPMGPPPKKPPRTFGTPNSELKEKKNAKKMLEKLEQVLSRREALSSKNEYDIAETDLSKDLKNELLKTDFNTSSSVGSRSDLKNTSIDSKPKEIHYLCTEILDITQRTLLPNQNKDCFKLNCAKLASTTSLPYTRLSMNDCSCNSFVPSHDSKTFSNDTKCHKCTLSDSFHPSLDRTFTNDTRCVKCQINDDVHGFKCHLNCKCGKSEFFVEKEHIYDEPCVENRYGTLNTSKLCRSMEDLKAKDDENQKIYDIPCDISRPETPETTDFVKLRNNFEKLRNTFESDPPKIVSTQRKSEKPLLTPKPNFVKKFSKSTENLTDEKSENERKFSTEKYRRDVRISMPRTDVKQLDIDRDNLNRLMNEIYDTFTVACNMEEKKPGSFPTEHTDSGSTSEDSVKLTRSLTEKRKNYVRRVSSRVAYLDQSNIKSNTYKRFRNQTSICSIKSENLDTNPYFTFRSWKSFRTSQTNLNRMDATDSKLNLTDLSTDVIDNSLDEKTGCVDIELPFEPRERGLFNVCMLVGLNYMTGQAYVKSVFPNQVKVPPHIENLVFPETLSWTGQQRGEWSADAQTQCYSIILTDERGERAYGYCRRVLPEGATTCLPLCYCIIGKYRAPGFYYKVLQEIESLHGSSEQEIQNLLNILINTDFPNPGETITLPQKRHISIIQDKSKTLPDLRRSGEADESMENMELPMYMDLENNNKRSSVHFDGNRLKIIKRPIEPRIDEDNLSTLLDTMGAGLLVKIFGSLLLERKVIIVSDKLSLLSSCMEALQSSLYPLVWQQPLISCIPREIQRDVLEAPLPMLAGVLRAADCDAQRHVDEGMLIDLTNPAKVLVYVGDESTILPTSSYKTLKTSLQMESIKYKDKPEDSKTRNVLISEAFLRFFVDILGDYYRYFNVGEMTDSSMGKNGVVFDKEAFIKSATSKQNQYFLDWFTETAMFNHFIQNMALCHRPTSPNTSTSPTPPTTPTTMKMDSTVKFVDTPLPDFYQLFEERVKSRHSADCQKNSEKNYKSAVNKKVKLLKSKLRDLIT